MFNNVALDVAIGLIFIFLLYSLLATIIVEMLDRWLGIRARYMVKIVRRMLEDEKRYLLARLIKPDNKSKKGLSFTKAFYAHPNIKYLAESRWNSKPSYIGAAIFSETIIDLLRGDEYDNDTSPMMRIKDTLFDASGWGYDIEPETRDHLKKMWINANEDLDKFKALLEVWFDRTMERGTGWYKRRVQTMLLVIGLLLAAIFNIDTIAIRTILAKDKGAREQMVALAASRYQEYGRVMDTITTWRDSAGTYTTVKTSHQPVHDSVIANTYKRLQNDADSATNILGLGRGPRCHTAAVDSAVVIAKICKAIDSLKGRKDSVKDYRAEVIGIYTTAHKDFMEAKTGCKKCGEYIFPNGWMSLFGWLITAVAISLGSPFWFDLLNKIMMLRASGKKPEEKKVTDNRTGNIPPDQRVG